MRHEAAGRRLTLVGVAFLLAIAPFSEGPAGNLLPLTALTIAAVVLGTTLLQRVLWSPIDRATVRSPALAPLLLFLIVSAASVAWSVDPFVSLVGLGRVLACTVLALLVPAFLREPEDASRLCAVFVLLAVLLSVPAICQPLAGHSDFVSSGAVRAHSIFATPNTFGAFVLIGLPLALCLALTARSPAARAGFWLAAALLLVALALSHSRGAWLAAAAAMGFLMLWLCHVSARRMRLPLALGIAAVAIVGALLLMTFSPQLRERALTAVQPFKAATFRERLTYWRSSLRMVPPSLPLGTGLDTYHLVYPAYRHPSLTGTTQWYAHNDYLQLLVELGPHGLLALLWLLWCVLRMATRVLRAERGSPEGILLTGCCAAAGGALLHSFVDYNLYLPETALPVFACFGVIAAAHTRTFPARGAVPGLPEKRSGLRRGVSLTVLAAGTAAAVFALRPFLAQQLIGRDIRNAPLAVAACPLSANYWFQLARAQALAGMAQAQTSCRRAIQLSPRTAIYHAFLAQLAWESAKRGRDCSETEKVVEHLRRACALDRCDRRFRVMLAQACLETGRAAEAMRHLEFCLELDRWRPDVPFRAHVTELLNNTRSHAAANTALPAPQAPGVHAP